MAETVEEKSSWLEGSTQMSPLHSINVPFGYIVVEALL